MRRSYMVVFERVSEDNWGAWTPDISGAVGAGESIDDARRSVREGIGIMLEDLVDRQLPVPEANAMSVDFSAFDPDPATSHYEIEWLSVDLPEAPSVATEHAQQAA